MSTPVPPEEAALARIRHAVEAFADRDPAILAASQLRIPQDQIADAANLTVQGVRGVIRKANQSVTPTASPTVEEQGEASAPPEAQAPRTTA